MRSRTIAPSPFHTAMPSYIYGTSLRVESKKKPTMHYGTKLDLIERLL